MVVGGRGGSGRVRGGGVLLGAGQEAARLGRPGVWVGWWSGAGPGGGGVMYRWQCSQC